MSQEFVSKRQRKQEGLIITYLLTYLLLHGAEFFLRS